MFKNWKILREEGGLLEISSDGGMDVVRNYTISKMSAVNQCCMPWSTVMLAGGMASIMMLLDLVIVAIVVIIIIGCTLPTSNTTC